MNAWQSRIDSIKSTIEMYRRELEVLEALGDIPAAYVYPNFFGKDIDITPPQGTTARDLALKVIARLREKGQAPPIATKKLEASTGKITYEVPGPMEGWTLKVSGGDPRCRVVPVTKTRTVAAKPAVAAVEAHEEEYTEYVIENPEECGAS
jgi:hypothetical protein